MSDGRRPIATGYLSHSGDLKIPECLNMSLSFLEVNYTNKMHINYRFYCFYLFKALKIYTAMQNS